MPIRVACPSCSRKFNAPDEHRGKSAKCPLCGQLLLISECEVAPSFKQASPAESDEPRGIVFPLLVTGLLCAVGGFVAGSLFGSWHSSVKIVSLTAENQQLSKDLEDIESKAVDLATVSAAREAAEPIAPSHGEPDPDRFKIAIGDIETSMVGDGNWRPLRNLSDYDENTNRVYGHPSGYRIAFSNHEGERHPYKMVATWDYTDEEQQNMKLWFWLHAMLIGGEDEATININGDRSEAWEKEPSDILVLKGAVIHSKIISSNKAEQTLYAIE